MGVALKLDEMSLADKLQTMETLWDDLCHHVQDIAVPEWHYEVLAARETDLRDGKEQSNDWESAKEKIRESSSSTGRSVVCGLATGGFFTQSMKADW